MTVTKTVPPDIQAPTQCDACGSTNVIYDQEKHEVVCGGCGIQLDSVKIGTASEYHQIPAAEWVRRARIEYQKLELEVEECQARMTKLRSDLGLVRNVKCIWPECNEPPHLQSRWCPRHRVERERQMATERQRRLRQRKRGLVTVVTPAESMVREAEPLRRR